MSFNSDANPSSDAKIHYHWSYDAAYYKQVVDRYYRQLPYILHLPVQYTLLWLGSTILFAVLVGPPTLMLGAWALLIGALGIPGLVLLTRQGIALKYRLRTSFGTDVDYFASETGITIREVSIHGTYPWTTYSRAVRFSDGILLLKPGAIRWLPDHALQRGTVDEAIALVRSNLPTRQLS